jgi:hypothetical protein
MAEILANLAEGVLQTTMNGSVTSLVLGSGQGALFPATGNFRVTCESEIMLCTARSSDTLTVTRGQEGTSAVGHTSGVAVAHTLTKGGLDQYLSEKGYVVPSAMVLPVDIRVPVSNVYWDSLGIGEPRYFGYWDFVKDVLGYADGFVKVPPNVTSASIRLSVMANATSGVTRWYIRTFASADGASLSSGTADNATAQDITVPGTAYNRKDITFTVPSTFAAGDILWVRFVHDGAHANDTLAVDTLLLGAWLVPA